MSNREVCEHCEGSGQCPDCDGVGYVTGPTENPDEAPSVGGQQQNAADRLELRHAGSATMETRSGGALEVREAPGGGLTLTGLACRTEVPYMVGGDFEEQIRRGAFKRTLGEKPTVVLRVEHDGVPHASTTNGTLHLAEYEAGLTVRAELDRNRSDSRDLAAAVRRGDMGEMSFAFRATEQAWNEDHTVRTIKAVEIHRGDVSVCAFGANPTTSVAMRSGALGLEQRAAFARDIGDAVRGYCAVRGGARRPSRRKAGAVPVVHTYLPIARAKRAKLGRAAGSSSGVSARADRPKYDAEALAKLGKEGKAHKKLSGPGYHYPIADQEDLENAIQAIGRAKPSERQSIIRFIKMRARQLKLTYLLPEHWTEPA